jgi:hypothetical protein
MSLHQCDRNSGGGGGGGSGGSAGASAHHGNGGGGGNGNDDDDADMQAALKLSLGNHPTATHPSGTVRVFEQDFSLEDAIGSHACSLEANMRLSNGIPLGSPLLLPLSP